MKNLSLCTILLIIVLIHNSYAQHPNFPGLDPVPGTDHLWEGTLKFNTLGPSIPYIDVPYEYPPFLGNTFYRETLLPAYDDFHFIPEGGNPVNEEWLNIRMIYPDNYDPNRAEPYPVIMIFSGIGEVGRQGCCGFQNIDPDNPMWDNNGYNLKHGEDWHYYAVKQGFHPSYPGADWTNEYSFDGFVLFPQSHRQATYRSSDLVGIIEEMNKGWNIDLDRIYLHGLSNGALVVWQLMNYRPDLIAAGAPISGINSNVDFSSIAQIPLMIVNGGEDTNPGPGYVLEQISTLEANGAEFTYLEAPSSATVIDPYNPQEEKSLNRHFFIPDAGHGVWEITYRRRDFFSWFLSKSKKDIFVVGRDTVFCPGSSFSVELRHSPGFTGYEWFLDDTPIPNSNDWTYTATEFGVYKLRYSRVDNPDFDNPDHWTYSHTVEITEYGGEFSPDIIALGSTVLPSNVGEVNDVVLQGPDGFSGYQWLLEGSDILGATSQNYTATQEGNYTLTVVVEGGCESDESSPIYVSVGNDPGIPNSPTGFTATVQSETEILVEWIDQSADETAFEIYMSEFPTTGPYIYINIDPDEESYLYQGLIPGKAYFFHLRAVNNNGGSAYVQTSATTNTDNVPPSAPINLSLLNVSHETINFTWEASIDDVGIDYYEIYVNSILNSTTSNLGFVINGLSGNTLYAINVIGVDLAGNKSPMSSQLAVRTLELLGSGIYYEFFDVGSPLSSVDEISALTPDETGTLDNFDITLYEGTIPDNFAYRFTGYIQITAEGSYTFRVESNNGSMLYINGAVVVDNDGTSTYNRTGSINLVPGYHPFELLYFDNCCSHSLTVSYEHQTFEEVEIPDEVLFRFNDNALPSPPTAPDGLVGTPISASMRIDLVWNDVSGETGYEIYRSNTTGGPYSIIGSTSANQNSYSDSNLDPLTSYFYVVRAKNLGGISDPSNEENIISPDLPLIPTAPSLLDATVNASQLRIELTWQDNSTNETAFQIERSIGNNQNYAQLALAAEDADYFEDSDITTNTTYFYRIRAINAGGGSSYTNEVSIASPKSQIYVNITSYVNYEGGIWNDLDAGEGGISAFPYGPLLDMTNNYGQVTNVDISISQAFNGWFVSGVTSGALYPTNVMSRYLYTSGATSGHFTISGLDPEKLYNFYMMSSKDGASGDYETKFSIGTNEYVIDALGNADILSPLLNISPDINGEVVLEVTANSGGQGIINALVIEEEGMAPSNTYYAMGGFDINDPVNWGVNPDGSGGGLSDFSGDDMTYIIDNNATIASDWIVTGTNSKVVVNDNITLNVQGSVSNLALNGLELASDVNLNILNVADTFNLKIINSELVLGNNSVLDIGENTLTIESNATLNALNSNGALATSKGNIILRSNVSTDNHLNFVEGSDSVNHIHVEIPSSNNLTLGTECYLTGSLKMQSGNLNSGGYLVLVSDENIDASIEKIEAGASVVGDVLHQRYWSRTVGSYGFFLIGTPISGQTIGDWLGDFYIQGVESSLPGAWKNLGVYDESISAFTSVASENDAIAPGVGVNAFMFSSNFTDGNIKYENTGLITQGAFEFDLTYTEPQAEPGWMLVSNPYPSTIDWSNIGWGTSPSDTINNVGSAFYVWDQASGAYRTWSTAIPGGSSLIAAGQGFFIKSSGTNPKLIITEKVKANETTSFYRKSTPENTFQLIAEDVSGHIDNTYIALKNDATVDFDPLYDAYKKDGYYVNLASIDVTEKYLAINTLPINNDDLSIPLSFTASTSGTFTFTFKYVSSLTNGRKLMLLDRYLEETIEIENESFVYTFSLTEDISSSGDNRFELIVTAPEKIKSEVNVKVLSAYGNPVSQVPLEITNDGNITTYTTDSNGSVLVQLIEYEQYNLVAPRFSYPINGNINFYDLVLLKRHLKGRGTFSPEQYVIADIDCSNSVDRLDIKALRKLIMKKWKKQHITQGEMVVFPPKFDFIKNGSTYMADLSYSFVGGPDLENINLRAFLKGDISSFDASNLRMSGQELEFAFEPKLNSQTNKIEMEFSIEDISNFNDVQLLFNYRRDAVKLVSINSNLIEFGKELFYEEENGKLLILMEDLHKNSIHSSDLRKGLVKLVFSYNVTLDELQNKWIDLIEKESFAINDNMEYAAIISNESNVFMKLIEKELIHSLYPNPVTNFTTLKFYLPSEQNVEFKLVNNNGKAILEDSRIYSEGFNYWEWRPLLSSAVPGVYFLMVKTEKDSFVKKIIVK